MIGIAVRFLSGRFHATPWGRHANETIPEWPPSPWRMLRAIVATWKQKLDTHPSCPSDVVESLLKKLVVPPCFVLPDAAFGHTRSYMPWFKKGPADRTLIMDTFVCIDSSKEVVWLWPEISLEEKEALACDALASHLGFLGRAESWIEARMLGQSEANSFLVHVNCLPLTESVESKMGEPVRVLCPHPIDAFGNEHTPKSIQTMDKGKNKRTILTPLYDPDWHLCMETLELHNKRWADPPGSRWVLYVRRKDCFSVNFSRPHRPWARFRPTIARYALDASVLPLVEDTLPIAELARRTCMGLFRRIEEHRLYHGTIPQDVPLPRSVVFSGKDDTGTPLQGHRHAYYLPTDEDGDGRIDHLTIIASMGFGPSEVRALDAMQKIRPEKGDPISLLLTAIGVYTEIAVPKLLGPASTWISATPFLATRFPKARGRKRDPLDLIGSDHQRAFARQVLIEQIRRERPDLPEPMAVEPLNAEHRCGAHGLRPIQFKRYRQKRNDDGGRRAAGTFRIVFSEPVKGPICLGHSGHFGMGLFIPSD